MPLPPISQYEVPIPQKTPVSLATPPTFIDPLGEVGFPSKVPLVVNGVMMALLKQVPDLFSTLFTIPKDNNVIAGNEYFREVGRDDEWVKQFVCNAKIGSSYAATNTITKPSGCP